MHAFLKLAGARLSADGLATTLTEGRSRRVSDDEEPTGLTGPRVTKDRAGSKAAMVIAPGYLSVSRRYYANGTVGGTIPWEIEETGFGAWTLVDHYGGWEVKDEIVAIGVSQPHVWEMTLFTLTSLEVWGPARVSSSA